MRGLWLALLLSGCAVADRREDDAYKLTVRCSGPCVVEFRTSDDDTESSAGVYWPGYDMPP